MYGILVQLLTISRLKFHNLDLCFRSITRASKVCRWLEKKGRRGLGVRANDASLSSRNSDRKEDFVEY